MERKNPVLALQEPPHENNPMLLVQVLMRNQATGEPFCQGQLGVSHATEKRTRRTLCS